jgi:tetratricopeptide (TPR) repeat protein
MMKAVIHNCLLLFLLSVDVSAQNIDSLKSILRTSLHDTSRCKVLGLLAETAPDGEWEQYNEELKTLCELKLKSIQARDENNLFYKKQYATALSNSGFIYQMEGKFPQAMESYHKSMKLQEEIGDKKGYATSLNNMAGIYEDQGDISKALEYFEKGLKIYEEIGDKKGMAQAINNIGNLFSVRGDVPKALHYFSRSLKLREEIGDKQGTALLLGNLAVVYKNQGDFSKALEYQGRSLKIREEIGDKKGVTSALNNIGYIYQIQGDVSKALEYYNKSLKIRQEIGDKQGIGISLTNVGAAYAALGKITLALEYYNKSLTLQEEIGDKLGTSTSLNNIGHIYQLQGDPFVTSTKEQKFKAGLLKALECFFKSLKLREEIQDKQGIAYSFRNIGHVYFLQKKFDKAIEYASKSMLVAKELNFPEHIRNAAYLLFLTNKSLGNYKPAIENYELFIKMRDSLNNEETRKASIKSQLKYDYEKQAAKDSIRNAEKIVQETIKHEEAIKKQRFYTYGGGIGFALMIVIAGISFRAYRNKQKANDIISEQKKLVESQKHLVEEKQKEILDSIHYARRIQKALITNETYILKNISRLHGQKKTG